MLTAISWSSINDVIVFMTLFGSIITIQTILQKRLRLQRKIKVSIHHLSLFPCCPFTTLCSNVFWSLYRYQHYTSFSSTTEVKSLLDLYITHILWWYFLLFFALISHKNIYAPWKVLSLQLKALFPSASPSVG